MEVKSKKKKYKEVDSLMEYYVKEPSDTELVAKLKLIVTILTVVSILSSAMFIFLPVYYRVMSIVCMVIFIVTFALYIKYNDVVSFIDRGWDTDYTKANANVSAAIMAPTIGMTIQSVISFTFTDYKMFWIWTTALAALILFLFFIFTEEYKMNRSAILVIVLAVLFYAPSAVAQANAVLDFSKPKVTQSMVQQMQKTKNSKSGYSYSIKAAPSNGIVLQFQISEEYYKKLSVGDKVIIYEKPGFLKIPNVALRNAKYPSRWYMELVADGLEDNLSNNP